MLLQSYRATRRYSEQLCAPLNPEDYVPQVAEFASPIKWHLAHVSWFFEEMLLKKHLPGYQPLDPDFAFLFNSYYQSLGDRLLRARRGVLTRPSVEAVYTYRHRVDTAMEQLLKGRLDPDIRALVLLGINHEQQHQELILTDLKYLFAQNPIYPIYDPDSRLMDSQNESDGWVAMEAGLYDMGHRGAGFAFDNEGAPHPVRLPDYHIANRLVTNGEYLEFIDDGGYRSFHHWLDDAWTWVQDNGIEHPLYWRRIDGQWYQYSLAGLKPLDPDAILGHISYYEAQAYAHWKGCRLPTEFEWEAAADQLDWGARWEWTNSAYLPYPGFRVSAGAVGEYNGKFMANQMVLRGASVATPAGHSRSTYRNFFHPQMQWQYSGIRLAI